MRHVSYNKRICITNVITLKHPLLKCLWISMRFFVPVFSRRVSDRKGIRGEKKRMLIFIAGLLFLTSNLPISNGVQNEIQEAAFCSSNVCYTAHLSKVKFPEAQKNCTNKGGNLVTIKSEEEAELVHTLLSKLTKNSPLNQPLKLWIGLKLKKCVIKQDLLKGFFWTTGDEKTAKSQFSNWMNEPRSTCIKEMCVSIKLHTNPLKNFKWEDSMCSTLFDGYICKYDSLGMCQPLVLAGPGQVDYETPFSLSSSLNLFPYASFGYVSCGHQREGKRYDLMCKDVEVKGNTVYQWVSPRTNRNLGALCVSEDLGCNYNNGGCEHQCIENSEKGSISCKCNDGYVLAPDFVSCVLPDHCQSHQCEHKCINHLHGHECTCASGFVLAEDKRSCSDINECLENPCNYTCINTIGSFECRCPTGFIWQGTQCLDIDECNNPTCSHGCLNTYGSYLCSCNNGYVLDIDKRSCLDIDECVNSPCADSCENIPGSYMCTCPKGFKLSSDRISCIPELQNANTTPTGHVGKDSGPENRETTSNSQRDMTNQPTPSSVFQASFTKKGDKIHMMSTPASSEASSSSSNNVADQVISDHQDGYSMVLLVSILCACGVVLVLLIVAGGFLCYRKKNAKNKKTEKQSSATDKYCWVPESENKTNNDYR